MGKNKKNINHALKGKIVEKYGTIYKFADAFGISRQAMYKKISGEFDWTLTDIFKASDLLGIKDDSAEMMRIFFHK